MYPTIHPPPSPSGRGAPSARRVPHAMICCRACRQRLAGVDSLRFWERQTKKGADRVELVALFSDRLQSLVTCGTIILCVRPKCQAQVGTLFAVAGAVAGAEGGVTESLTLLSATAVYFALPAGQEVRAARWRGKAHEQLRGAIATVALCDILAVLARDQADGVARQSAAAMREVAEPRPGGGVSAESKKQEEVLYTAGGAAGLSEAEASMLNGTWPSEVLQDPLKQARVAASAVDFVRQLLLGDHLTGVLVLPRGTELLGLAMEECLPSWLVEGLAQSPPPATAIDLLRSVPAPVLDGLRARLEYVSFGGKQRELLAPAFPFHGSGSGEPDAWRNLTHRLAAAEGVLAEGVVKAGDVYVCEMRTLREHPHPISFERTKSLCSKHVRDAIAPLDAHALYWNCHEDGVFLGARGSGKGVHVDQVMWSNVGKNWSGYKLFAVWPPGVITRQVAEDLADEVLSFPLSQRHRAALLQAQSVVLVRPGDVFAFSGGVAHTTLSVSDELNVTAYESLVTLHPAVVAHFLHTGATSGPFALDRGVMELDSLTELRGEMVHRLVALADRYRLAQGEGSASASASGPGKRRKLEQGAGVYPRDPPALKARPQVDNSDAILSASPGHGVKELEGLTEALSAPLWQGTFSAVQQLLAHAGFRGLLQDLGETQLRGMLVNLSAAVAR